MKNRKLYCNLCERTTPHKYRGRQKGVSNKHLDLYDCLECRDTSGRWKKDGLDFEPQNIGSLVETQVFDIPDNSTLAEQFRKNHNHLWRWLKSGLGRRYREKQNE